MLGLETIASQYFGDSYSLLMLAGFAILVVLDLGVTLWLEWRRKNLQWRHLPDFIQPIMLIGIFLIGLEALMIASAGFISVYAIFQGLQIVGYVAVLAKYFDKFYRKLKELGLPVSEQFDDKLRGITGEAQQDIQHIVEEYMRKKENEKKGS
jgi:Fe2+ transport system protein B